MVWAKACANFDMLRHRLGETVTRADLVAFLILLVSRCIDLAGLLRMILTQQRVRAAASNDLCEVPSPHSDLPMHAFTLPPAQASALTDRSIPPWHHLGYCTVLLVQYTLHTSRYSLVVLIPYSVPGRALLGC